ncbi:type II toxin-antitoxin system death-on-curing family toxin [Microvirga brassicacearum]|uniref:Type II toxin-antitoxin system death-on-curing family toxin n=1 Tax=Microvirga brassicacearum TaxID=2580413 RepID=A0A5N3PB67_9HYPH|nr:type II toxin-antitoxin system death-on-curing family toxin [Microvirga brassicacearum]KAB0266996.1 type II toxin-antitoxin system death-on-curing family toxin [Microvirga brassicacearum]
MTAIRWISKRLILSIHAAQLAEHGGINGIRDEGLLDSALARPELKAQYGSTHLPLLAAAYAFGIAKNHPFLDGNKRTAYVAMELFLAKNGLMATASDEESVITFLKLAAGEVGEDELAQWIEHHLMPIQP